MRAGGRCNGDLFRVGSFQVQQKWANLIQKNLQYSSFIPTVKQPTNKQALTALVQKSHSFVLSLRPEDVNVKKNILTT